MKRLLCTSVLLLGACSHQNTLSNSPAVSDELITLESFQITDNHIEFGVMSTGCTTIESFALDQTIDIENQCWVSIQRTKADLCKRTPFIKNIVLPLKNTETCSEMKIKNPIIQQFHSAIK